MSDKANALKAFMKSKTGDNPFAKKGDAKSGECVTCGTACPECAKKKDD